MDKEELFISFKIITITIFCTLVAAEIDRLIGVDFSNVSSIVRIVHKLTYMLLGVLVFILATKMKRSK